MIEQQPVVKTRQSLSRNSANTEDIIKFLDKLEELVEESPQVGTRALWVNADRLFMYTNKIRAFLPDDLKRASKLSREGEKLLQDAQEEVAFTLDQAREEAERIIQDARSTASQMLATHEIRQKAEEQAAQIVQEAKADANEIRTGADQYAKEVLAGLDAFLQKIQGTVQRGRSKLEQQQESRSFVK